MTLKKKASNDKNSLSPTNSNENSSPHHDFQKAYAEQNPGLFIDFDESDEEEFEGYISKSFASVDKKLLLEELSVLKLEKNQRKNVMKSLKKFNLKWILLWSKTLNFQYWLQTYNPVISSHSPNQLGINEKELVLFENGDIFLGNLEGGIRKGSGLLYEKCTRYVYNGNWDDNEKNGPGVLNSLNNEFIYDGEFNGNKKHGYGKLITPKLKYSGCFKKFVIF